MKPNILTMVMLTCGILIGTIIMAIYGSAKIPDMPMVGQIFSILGLSFIALSLLLLLWQSER